MRAALVGLVALGLLIGIGWLVLRPPVPEEAATREERVAPTGSPTEIAEGTTEEPAAPRPKLPLGGVCGRVLAAEDGRPLEGIVVLCGKRWPDGEPGRDDSDAEGRYEIADLVAGTGVLRARGRGRATRSPGATGRLGIDGVVVTIRRDDVTEQDLVLERGATIRGVVLDPDGDPAPGVTVAARFPSPPKDRTLAGYARERDGPATTTDAAGRFGLDTLLPGVRYLVEARSEGFATVASGPWLTLADRPREIELRFAPARWLEVVVLESTSGQPMEKARVTVYRQGPLRSLGSFVTGPDGVARVGPVPDGPTRLNVHHEECLPPQDKLDVAPDARRLEVRLERGLAIAGRLVLPEGLTLEDRELEAQSVRIDDPTFKHEWGGPGKVGTAGRFRVAGLPAGRYHLSAHVAGGDRRFRGEAEAKAGTADLAIPMTESGPTPIEDYTLTVRVVGPSGDPVPRARLRFFGEVVKARGRGVRRVEEGCWRIRVLEKDLAREKRWWVEVWDARDARGRPLPVPGIQAGPFEPDRREVRIVLPAEETIDGRMLDAEGRGIPGVVVRAVRRGPGGAGQSETVSGPDGSYRLGRLAAGRYRLDLDLPAGFVTPAPVETAAGTGGVDVTLIRGRRAIVTVVDGAGHPVSGAWVQAKHGAYGVNVVTDASGMALLEGLPPDLRGLRAGVSGKPGLGQVELPDWTPSDTTVTLPREEVVSGWVRTPDGRPAARAVLRWSADGKKWTRVWIHPRDAAFLIRGPKTEEIRLSVCYRHGEEEPRRWVESIVAAGTRDHVVIADPGPTIDIVVEDWPEEGYGDAFLLLDDPREGDENPLSTDGVGRFVFHGLRAEDRGTVWIRAHGSDRCWLGRNVFPAKEPRRVKLIQGRRVRGRIRVPEASRIGVRIVELGLATSSKEDGRFEFRCVPPGAWTLKIGWMVDRKWHERLEPLPPSGELDLDPR